MRAGWAAWGAVAGAALALASCAEGRKPPTPTKLVAVFEGLTFVYGDIWPCTEFNADPFTCETECLPGQQCVSVDPIMPPVKVEVQPFCIDEHEVTNIQYLFCEEMGKCPTRSGDDLPTTNIADYAIDSKYDHFPAIVTSYEAASSYCEFVGKRLPTEFEWELVAGGPAQDAQALSDKRLYPFLPAGERDVDECLGLDIALPACRGGVISTSRVGTSADDVVELSGGGRVYDLGGNVKEWTSTLYREKVTCEQGSEASCNNIKPELCKCGGGPCYRICEAQKGDVPICAARFDDETVITDPEATISPKVSTDRVIKGGFFYMEGKDICQSRSTGRDHKTEVGFKTHPALGLRCAATKGQHSSCQ